MYKSTNWHFIHFAYEWCRQGRLDRCRQRINILLWALPSQFFSQLCNLKLELLHLLNQINRLWYFICNFWQGGTQKAVVTAIFKVKHSSMQLQSKKLEHYTGTGTKNTKPKLPKPIVRFYLTLNFTPELTKPKLLLLTRIAPNLSLQSYPASAANTTLGIYYTCIELCCSAHGCCVVECGIVCCAA